MYKRALKNIQKSPWIYTKEPLKIHKRALEYIQKSPWIYTKELLNTYKSNLEIHTLGIQPFNTHKSPRYPALDNTHMGPWIHTKELLSTLNTHKRNLEIRIRNLEIHTWKKARYSHSKRTLKRTKKALHLRNKHTSPRCAALTCTQKKSRNSHLKES